LKGTYSQLPGILDRFQDPKSKSNVMLLNVSDSSAAGANLTNTNHIFFVCPILTSTKSEFIAKQTQAIGRARRYGQTKKVYVYKMCTVGTKDSEIYEMREPKSYYEFYPERKPEKVDLKMLE